MTHPAIRLTRRDLVLAAAAATLAAPALAQNPGLAETLRAGGLTIFFRHGATTWNGVDRIDWPRERQRLLSPEGEAQAAAIGAGFRDLGLPVGDVLSSPFDRCLATARIAFGKVVAEPRLLGLQSDSEGVDERRAYVRALAAETLGPGANRIVVTHRSNISAATGESPHDAGAVVTRGRGGSAEVLAVLAPEGWAALG